MDPRRLLTRLVPKRRAAAGCALAALATCLAASVGVMGQHGFKPSVLVHMSDTEPMAAVARATDPGFAFVPSPAHYDGVYFYAIARDPLARGPEHGLIDLGGYRYEHPGYGWLGWLLSAGQAKLVPFALLVALLACAAIAGAAAALLAEDLGLSPWWGLAVAFSPGVVFSATVLTSEPAGLAAMLLALYAWRRKRRFLATLALIAACLIKEPFLAVPVGIGIYELVRAVRARRWRERISIRSFVRFLAPLAAGPLAFVVWYVYVWWQFIVPPIEQSRTFTGRPFVGWVDTFKLAAAYATSGDFNASQIGALTLPLLVVAGVALLAGSIRSLGMSSEVQPIFVLLALVAFSLNYWNLFYPKDLIRALTVQFVLLPFVFAPGRARETLPTAPG